MGNFLSHSACVVYICASVISAVGWVVVQRHASYTPDVDVSWFSANSKMMYTYRDWIYIFSWQILDRIQIKDFGKNNINIFFKDLFIFVRMYTTICWTICWCGTIFHLVVKGRRRDNLILFSRCAMEGNQNIKNRIWLSAQLGACWYTNISAWYIRNDVVCGSFSYRQSAFLLLTSRSIRPTLEAINNQREK